MSGKQRISRSREQRAPASFRSDLLYDLCGEASISRGAFNFGEGLLAKILGHRTPATHAIKSQLLKPLLPPRRTGWVRHTAASQEAFHGKSRAGCFEAPTASSRVAWVPSRKTLELCRGSEDASRTHAKATSMGGRALVPTSSTRR